MNSQLLCTFTNREDVQQTLQEIREVYVIVYNYIYILQNKSNLDELFVTYNVNTDYTPRETLHDTILIHRKKESNTLYTINALNELIKEENNGVLDKTFIVDWKKFRNTIVLTNNEGTKKIPTKIYDVIEFN